MADALSRTMISVIIGLIVLGAIGAMILFNVSVAAIASLFIGIFLARVIPWLFNVGFETEMVWLRNHLFHMKHEKVLGTPNSVENGIMYYKTRPQLPLKMLLSKINEQMVMLALSFTVIVQNIDSIRPIIASGKRITFLVLNPNSDFVRLHTQLYSDGANLDTQIETSLGALLRLRDDYPDNVTIMTYNALAPWAITIIDDNIIKVEDRLIGRDSNSRPSHLTYKSNNPAFYDIYLREYNRIFNQASDFHPS